MSQVPPSVDMSQLPVEPLPQRDRVQIRIAWAGWVLLAVVMAVVVAREPVARSVTGNYRGASDLFWAGQAMYTPGRHGWIYLPNSALLYSPFTIGPRALGEALFRVVITIFYAWGLWRVAVMASPRAKGDYFPLMTLAAIPVAAGAIRSGQMNIPLAACMCLAVDALARRLDWRAAAWMTLGLLTKPLGLVLMMLSGALRPRTIAPMAVLVVASLALPFIKPDWGYVAQQYVAGVHKVLEAGNEVSDAGRERFADLGGALQTMGIELHPKMLTVLRAVAALGALVLAWLALKAGGINVWDSWRTAVKTLGGRGTARTQDARGQAGASASPAAILATQRAGWAWIMVLGLASAYLMLFNPRTEGLSYPILMPALGAMTCWAVFRDRRIVLGAVLGSVCVLMAIAHVFTKGGDTLLRPLGTLMLLGIMAVEVVRTERARRAA